MCRLPVLLLFCVFLSGCGRKNPVTEVSVAQSGIEVVGSDEATTIDGWPFWRGPHGNGIAADQELVTNWDENTNVRWRADIPGRGHSSPIVVGDSIYLATALDDQQNQMVLALDRSNGEQKWMKLVQQGGFPSARQLHQKSTHANGTIASDGKRLFVAFLGNEQITATALDLDGEVLWSREIGKFVSKFGYAPSPVLYKSLVIFAADNQGGGYLAAVDAETGEIAWRVARGNVSSYSSPLVANVGGRDQLLISGCDAVASYDPATGEQNWSTPCTAESTCGTVVATDELIFASGGYPDKETVCLSADGKKIWSNNTKVYEPSLLIAGKNLYAVADDGIAYCWTAESGELNWKKRLGGNFSASPIASAGRIYVSNLNGDTFVFTAAAEYELVSKNHFGDDCYASPAAVDDELYLRIGIGQGKQRREQLVCIAKPDLP